MRKSTAPGGARGLQTPEKRRRINVVSGKRWARCRAGIRANSTRETGAKCTAEIYRSTHGSRRRSAANSFQVGLARGIIRKLDTLRRARDVAGGITNGRALVPIKESIIDEEMDRLGLSFRHRSAVRRMVLPAAFSAGQEAGERFEYRPGIERG